MASVRVTKGGGLDNGVDSSVGRRQIENMLIGEQMGYGGVWEVRGGGEKETRMSP